MVYDMNTPDISLVEEGKRTNHCIMDIPLGLADKRAHWKEYEQGNPDRDEGQHTARQHRSNLGTYLGGTRS